MFHSRSNLGQIFILVLTPVFFGGCLQESRLEISSAKDFGSQGLTISGEDTLEGGIARATMSLNYISPHEVRFRIRTEPIDAVENFDYHPVDQIVTIPAGQNKVIVPVTTFKQTQAPADHRLRVVVSEVTGAPVLTSDAVITVKEPRYTSVIKGVKRVNVSKHNVCVALDNKLTYCWGRNNFGQTRGDGNATTNVVYKTGIRVDSDPLKIVGEENSLCALYPDGRTMCWGSNDSGQISRPTGAVIAVQAIGEISTAAQPAVDVAAGPSHTCIVQTNGAVLCKGLGTQGQLGDGASLSSNTFVTVAGLSAIVTAISASEKTTCAILNTGALECWGNSASGEAGNGDVNIGTIYSTATPNLLIAGVTQIASGQLHHCAIVNPGNVYCWGANASGQLGRGTIGAASAVPTAVTLPRPAVAVAAAGAYSCARLDNGEVYCWGANTNGNLGDGTLVSRSSPVKVVLPEKAVQISVGEVTACAVLETERKLNCWGSNHYATARATTSDFTYAVDMPDLIGVKVKDISLNSVESGLSAGPQSGCAVLENGEARCWGANTYYQLGRGAVADVGYTLDTVTGLTAGSAATVQQTRFSACAFLQNAGVRCWGDNTFGEVGNNGVNNVGSSVDPAQTPTGLNAGVAEIASSFAHNCARMLDGTVKCWGYSVYGQAGACGNVMVPTDIAGIANAVSIATGDWTSCAITGSGQLKCWGNNGAGLFGNGSILNACTLAPVTASIEPVKKVALGGRHICALTVDGAVKCWGENTNGEMGVNGILQSSLPVPVVGLSSGVKDIAVGAGHSCALLDDGSVRCWGSDVFDRLGINIFHSDTVYTPTQVAGLPAGVAKIRANGDNTCAITVDNFAKCWGSNQGALRNMDYLVQPFAGEVFDAQISY